MGQTFETKINQIITVLMELEAKGCHKCFFEYVNGLVCVKIYRNEVGRENIVYERTINPIQEQAQLDKVFNFMENLKLHVKTTSFQCYRRDFVKGKISGEWEKTRPAFEFGKNAMQSMLIDGSGYYIDDPDNKLQYFVDLKHENETDM
ncbi:MAG: hypothetical protein LBH32_08650 [Dysgonamonadaceae bacterium]|jgi:hypothetical protein|nr:hypothetical protein [Dysgonamonadaceae bacterium]